MKATFSAVGATAVVVLASALAQTRTSPTIHPDSLARMEAITSYCEKADPAAESQYLSKLAGLTSGHSQDEIARDRNTPGYQQALKQASATLSRVTPGSEVKACTEFLAENE